MGAMPLSTTTTTPTTTTPAIPLPSAGSFLHAFLPFWPLFALVALVAVARLVQLAFGARRLRRSGIHEIDRMDGAMFERRLAVLFRALGYTAEITGRAAGDYGCDLIVKRDGRRHAVQAKRWGKNVGIKAVQEAAAARMHYGADAAMVVTNRYFTKQARALARSNHVDLWDRDRLVKALFSTATKKAAPEVLPTAEVAVAVAAKTPTVITDMALAAPSLDPICARCGESVSPKVYEYCIAHAATFGGLIYCFKHQRDVRRAR
jgi:restriction system protein